MSVSTTMRGTNLADSGFVDPAGARAISRRMRLRRRLRDATSSITTALELLDHPIEPDGHAVATCRQCGISLVSHDREGLVGGVPAYVIESVDVREQQLLDGVDLILQLTDALRLGLGHGLFSLPVVDRTSEPDLVSHRLCGAAE